VQRAASVLHESRHGAGHSHIADTECPRMASCDYSWDTGNWQEDGAGANRYEVVWLWWFSVEGSEVAPGSRHRAAANANTLLDTAFLWRPPYTVPVPP
jgi:hypothetical protein